MFRTQRKLKKTKNIDYGWYLQKQESLIVTTQLQLMRIIISLHACLGKQSVRPFGPSDISDSAMYLAGYLVRSLKDGLLAFPKVVPLGQGRSECLDRGVTEPRSYLHFTKTGSLGGGGLLWVSQAQATMSTHLIKTQHKARDPSDELDLVVSLRPYHNRPSFEFGTVAEGTVA